MGKSTPASHYSIFAAPLRQLPGTNTSVVTSQDSLQVSVSHASAPQANMPIMHLLGALTCAAVRVTEWMRQQSSSYEANAQGLYANSTSNMKVLP